MLVEELLEFFVGEVDAKLLERVCFEDFKAKNVQNSDGFALNITTRSNRLVDPGHQPVKHMLVDKFGQRVTGCHCFLWAEANLKRLLPAHSQHSRGDYLCELSRVHFEQAGSLGHSLLALNGALSVPGFAK